MESENLNFTEQGFPLKPLTQAELNELKEGDYIYHHSKPGYPLRKDFDAGDYYQVTGNDSQNKKISVNPIGKKEDAQPKSKLEYDKIGDNWWRDSIPPHVKKQMKGF